MISKAWKICELDGEINYRIQFEEVSWKVRKTLLEAMKGWNEAGVGWLPESGNQIFLFQRGFKNEQEWEQWANKFPVQIHESRYWGNKEKVVTHGKKKK